jgi:ectoine hydroxylase-related dioxygenase (phytanoyl-CoA dioxygenase family)
MKRALAGKLTLYQATSKKRSRTAVPDISSPHHQPRFNPRPIPNASLLTEAHVAQLERDGYTVVEGVFTPAQCDEIKAQWLAVMESYQTGFKADDKSTWRTDTLPVNLRGLQNWPPVSQESYVWSTRLATAPIFAQLWGVAESELISSMDRVCFVPAHRLRIHSGNTFGWWHIDQARRSRRGPLGCVQGFVSLNAIGTGEVALEVLAGAHQYHAQFFEAQLPLESPRELKCKNADWHKFSQEDFDWYLKQPNVCKTRVHMKPGSLVLWDSRMPHHAMPPADNAQRSTIDRYVIYSCMVPRAWVSPQTLKKRISYFEHGRTTSHWPQDGKPFGFKPYMHGQPLRNQPRRGVASHQATCRIL